jgi:hypothetical protein
LCTVEINFIFAITLSTISFTFMYSSIMWISMFNLLFALNVRVLPIKTKSGENMVLAWIRHLHPNKTLCSWVSRELNFFVNEDIIVIPCLKVLIIPLPCHCNVAIEVLYIIGERCCDRKWSDQTIGLWWSL